MLATILVLNRRHLMHARVRVLVFSLATLTLGAAPAVAQQTAAWQDQFNREIKANLK